MLQDEIQDRLEEMARQIMQETGYGWLKAYNIAIKVLVAAGDLEIRHQQ